MSEELTFDVYGRFRLRARPAIDAEFMEIYLAGEEGKRSRLHDVVVPDGATPDEIIRQIEAVFHELGRPGASVRLVKE